MVITFNTRFQDIKNRVAPILSKPRGELQTTDMNSSTPKQCYPKAAIIGHRLHSRDNNEVCHRHKRQKQDLAYAAANIEHALSEAGYPSMPLTLRRERALPVGSVDLNLSKVLTSSQYDEFINSNKSTDDAGDTKNEAENEDQLYYQALYTNYSNLIQSTRHYYNVSSSSESNKYANDENEKAKSESSSSMESGLSSFAPNSSNNDLKDNKDIDNDNRSDKSSLEEDGSISDSLSCEWSSFQDNMSKNKSKDPYAVVGWELVMYIVPTLALGYIFHQNT